MREQKTYCLFVVCIANIQIKKIRLGKSADKYLNFLLDLLYSEHVTVALFFFPPNPAQF